MDIDYKQQLVCVDRTGKVKSIGYNEPIIFTVQTTREFHDVHGYGKLYGYPNLTFNVKSGEITDNRNALNFNWWKCKFITIEEYNTNYRETYAITNK